MLIQTIPLTLDSSAPVELIDITDRVVEAVRTGGLRDGLASVMTRHTTSGIRLGESESGLFQDIVEFAEELAPPRDGYRHDLHPVDGRPNGHSHLLALLLGASETLPVRAGRLDLGDWQRIFFVELDGPRAGRTVLVTLIGA